MLRRDERSSYMEIGSHRKKRVCDEREIRKEECVFELCKFRCI